jgi:hypothetical protein
MRTLKTLIVACLLAVSLAGCMLPETIDAKIELNGYHYRIAMKSRVVATEALRIAMRGQELTAKMEDRLRAKALRALQAPGYTRFDYVGRGCYDTAAELSGELAKPGASIGFPFTQPDRKADNFLTVERLDDGTVEVKSLRIPEQTKRSLLKAGLTPSGTIEVKITGTVIENNATETPKAAGDPYRWTISSWNDVVLLRVASP